MKSVLVTGGAKRLGATMVRRFADTGWHVVIHCNTSRDAADALASKLPSAEVVQCDLADTGGAAAMMRDLAARLDDWRCLVNSASIFTKDDATCLDPDTNRQAMTVNAAAPALMAQTYFTQAKSKSTRTLVQITDQKLANPNPDFFSYSMSKAAADFAAQMLAIANDGDDRVYTLAPGAILPSHDQSEEEAEQSHRMNLLHRRTHADEIAEAALFLAEGPLASGQSIFVDSGQHLLDQDRDVIYLAREGENA